MRLRVRNRARLPRKHAIVFAMVGVAALSPSPSRADVPVRVDATGCGAIDVAEVERLVAIDVASVAEERQGKPFPMVRVECTDTRMRIVVDDPVTSKKLERELPLPREKGRERTIALAISQLFLTSWMELVIPEPPEPVGPPKDAPGAKAAKTVAKRAVAKASPTADVLLIVAARDRRGSALFGALRTSFEIASGFRLFAQVGWETNRVERMRGNVDATLASIGTGVGYRSPALGPLVLDAHLGAALSWVRLDGRPVRDATNGGSGSGITTDGFVSFGPTALLGPFRLGLEGQAGYLLPRVVGEVQGEEPVRIDGAWFGGAVVVGLGFGGI